MAPLPPLPPHTGGSAILKIVAIGILGVCLMIPLTLVWILVAERSQRRDEAVTETVSSIGKAQTVGGVVLDLPYEALERQPNGTTATVTRHAYVHPEQLTIEATATPEIRHRSLYEVIVYRTTVRLKGTIAPPDLARLNAAPVAVHWDRAATTVEIADLRGTLAVSPLTFGDRQVTLEPTTETAVFAKGVRGLTPLAADAATRDPVRRRPDARRQRRAAVRADRQGDRRPTRRRLAGSRVQRRLPADHPQHHGGRLPGPLAGLLPRPQLPARLARGHRGPHARCSSSAARRRSACRSCRRSTTTSRPSAR